MSKAFTREDDAEEQPVLPRPVSTLPPGARNYLTPSGAARLQAELDRLGKTDRPDLLPLVAAEGVRGAEAREELARVEQRIRRLHEILRTAELTAPPPLPHDTVRFGATVRVRDPHGVETAYRIVGVDEADYERDEISWQSPLARALLNSRLGQRVPFRLPSGTTQLEIVGIAYD